MSISFYDYCRGVGRCDPDEAPEGYRAVLKPAYKDGMGNICRQCDWRRQCNDPTTDLLAPGHRCMAGGVISRKDGKTYQRKDGASVLFKRKGIGGSHE